MEVTMRATQGLMGSALVGACCVAFSPAAAEPLSDSEKIERLERQTELLREQMSRQNDLITALKHEVAVTKKKSGLAKRYEPSVNSREEARQQGGGAAAPPYVPTRAEVIRGTQPAVPGPVAKFAGVQFSVWGWLEAATVYRNHNTVNDMLTVFDAIPYPNSPLYKEPQFNGTARQSQFSLLAEANIDSTQKLSGYLEWDYLGVGTESNYLVTNDWAQRLRHVYSTYDNDDLGIHILGGQNWSMM